MQTECVRRALVSVRDTNGTQSSDLRRAQLIAHSDHGTHYRRRLRVQSKLDMHIHTHTRSLCRSVLRARTNHDTERVHKLANGHEEHELQCEDASQLWNRQEGGDNEERACVRASNTITVRTSKR